MDNTGQETSVCDIGNDDNYVAGDFVFDPNRPWSEQRIAFLAGPADALQVCFVRRTEAEFRAAPDLYDLKNYPGKLLRDPLSLPARAKLSADEIRSWADFAAKVLRRLRDVSRRECKLKDLIQYLNSVKASGAVPIEDGLKLLVARGDLEVRTVGKDLVATVGPPLAKAYDRIDYLATFSEELRVKSRRIDLLVQHKGSVGSYREQLLRGLLSQLLPKRYEASTGFIEGCPRQIDLLVWDSMNYAPLFREQDVVVVPLEAVRAALEVKTTLDSKSLPEAMSLLSDVFRSRQTVAPIFKGVFAYENSYRSERAIAKRMARFYRHDVARESLSPTGHPFMWAGINAVCAANSAMVRERYREAKDEAFPQPFLTGLSTDWPGDPQTAIFLGVLLSHLDIPVGAQPKWFEPILGVMTDVDLGDIYDDWRPSSACDGLAATLRPQGAQRYRDLVHAFRRGDLRAGDIMATLTSPPAENDVGHDRSESSQ